MEGSINDFFLQCRLLYARLQNTAFQGCYCTASFWSTQNLELESDCLGHIFWDGRTIIWVKTWGPIKDLSCVGIPAVGEKPRAEKEERKSVLTMARKMPGPIHLYFWQFYIPWSAMTWTLQKIQILCIIWNIHWPSISWQNAIQFNFIRGYIS